LVYPWPRPTRSSKRCPACPPAHAALDGEELRGYDLNNTVIRIHGAACLIDRAVRELIEQHSFSDQL